MVQDTFQPGDLPVVSRDISKEDTLLFRSGEPVTVLAVWESPETEALFYLAQSPFTGEYSYLGDGDLEPSPVPAGDDDPPDGISACIQGTKEQASGRFQESFATPLLILSVVILYLLGGAMFLFFIWPVNEAMSDIGELFLPFGVFLVLLPTFLLGSPIVQRAMGTHDYDRQRTLILAQYSGALGATYGPDGGTVPQLSFPTGHEKCLCWRCGQDNEEYVSLCRRCGTLFNQGWLSKLATVNTYTSILFIWATVQFFILFPILLGDTFTDEFLQFYKYFYILCFLMYLLVLAPFIRLTRFSPAQVIIAFCLSPIPFLSMIYAYQRSQKNMGHERSMDLNHFRRGDGTVNVWHTMKEKQLKGIITASYFDTGKMYKEKPARRIKYLKHSAQLDPLNHRVLYHLAREHLASGNRLLGFYELDNALKLFPGNAQYMELKKMINSARGLTGS